MGLDVALLVYIHICIYIYVYTYMYVQDSAYVNRYAHWLVDIYVDKYAYVYIYISSIYQYKIVRL